MVAQMELARLIDGLSDPAAYRDPVWTVEVRQTHISAVFLAGDSVYKVKTPINYGFVDFGTLSKRRHYCDEEVRLNRRLAPDVYIRVVPVTRRDTQYLRQLQDEDCPLVNETDQMEEWRAPGHSTDGKVRACANCNKVMQAKRCCDRCGKGFSEEELQEGDRQTWRCPGGRHQRP